MKGCCAHIVTNRLTLGTKFGIKLKSIALKYREISISNKQTKTIIILYLTYEIRQSSMALISSTIELPIRVLGNIFISKISILDNFDCLNQ